MDLDALLDGLRARADRDRRPAAISSAAASVDWPDELEAPDERKSDDEPDAPAGRARAGGRRRDGRHDRLAAARAVLLDPGRRGARAMVLAAAIAAALTGAWVLLDSPAGQSRTLDRAAALSGAPSPPAAIGSTAGSSLPGSPLAGPAPSGPGSSAPAASAASQPGAVVVDVTGLVVTPGVYTLAAGSRVIDAVTMAGGAQPGADLTALNLARKLVDGEQIAVGVPGAPNQSAGTSPDTGTGAPGLVNLNTATVDDLDGLPGIGPVLAQSILAYRTSNGRFDAVDQLREVSGIGESKYAQLKDRVTV
jgi:competence protein ComEA